MTELTQELIVEFFKTKAGQKYVDQAINGSDFIIIDLDEMKLWNKDAVSLIINNAVRYGIRLVEKALQSAIQEMGVKDNPEFDVGFNGLVVPTVKIHNVASQDIGKLVRVKGLVSRTHFIKPMAKKVAFMCQNCSVNNYDIAVQNMKYVFQKIPFVLTTPERECEECEERVNWVALDEFSTFIDSQEFSLQEGHEDSHGRPPQILQMIVTKKHLINKIYCGNTVDIVGVVRLLPTFRFKTKSRFYIPYIEVYDIIKDSKEPEDVQITPEEEFQIYQLAQQPNIYDKLVQNVAPSIYGMEKFKEGALLSIVGGVDKNKGDIKIRGNIHVLGVGDAGMGKSQILLSATELSPKGISSVGRGVSGAGLTAALNKDETTGDWVVEAGTLVLADNGLATIDEIDKMTENDRMHIHEAMEQQTVTIHKGGRHVILRARTAVLAAANPNLGRYDPNLSVFDQMKGFPRTLFSRFDLIFVFADTADPEQDKRVTSQILSCKLEDSSIDRELLKKYIAYAKTINPCIKPEAEDYLSNYFLKIRNQMHINSEMAMRNASNPDGNTKVDVPIPITYRQLEGLRRIAEAHARILLKPEVDLEDAKAAEKIFGEYLKDIKFDITGHSSGVSKDKVNAEQTFLVTMKNLQQGLLANGVPYGTLLRELELKGIVDAKKMITDKHNRNIILEVSNGHYILSP